MFKNNSNSVVIPNIADIKMPAHDSRDLFQSRLCSSFVASSRDAGGSLKPSPPEEGDCCDFETAVEPSDGCKIAEKFMSAHANQQA